MLYTDFSGFAERLDELTEKEVAENNLTARVNFWIRNDLRNQLQKDDRLS